MRPDEEALRKDIASAAFQVGQRRHRWKFVDLNFPFGLFFVTAAPRPNGPPGFLLRSEFTGYPAVGPTSQLWHRSNNGPLSSAFRPKNNDGGVMEAFKDWQQCLYHPIDRIARDHNNWDREYPEKLWTPEKEITFLLETVYALLHSTEYAGASLPEEALSLPTTPVA